MYPFPELNDRKIPAQQNPLTGKDLLCMHENEQGHMVDKH